MCENVYMSSNYAAQKGRTYKTETLTGSFYIEEDPDPTLDSLSVRMSCSLSRMLPSEVNSMYRILSSMERSWALSELICTISLLRVSSIRGSSSRTTSLKGDEERGGKTADGNGGNDQLVTDFICSTHLTRLSEVNIG